MYCDDVARFPTFDEALECARQWHAKPSWRGLVHIYNYDTTDGFDTGLTEDEWVREAEVLA